MRTLIALFLLFPLLSQGQDCSLLGRVDAPSGLRIRSLPSTKGKMVGSVPYDSIVSYCADGFGALTVEGITDQWRKVRYKGMEGYAFGGFLSPQRATDPVREAPPMPTEPTPREVIATDVETPKAAPVAQWQLALEAVNYCGNIEPLKPGINWYGIFPRQRSLHLKKVELLIIKSKYNLHQMMEFDITTNRRENAIVLIGCSKPLDTTKAVAFVEERLSEVKGRLMPGQELEIYPTAPTDKVGVVRLTALGSLEAHEGGQELKSYKLRAEYLLKGAVVTQDLATLLPPLKREEPPRILWFGDLNGDQFPEVVLGDRAGEQARITLLVSNLNAKGGVYEAAALWAIDPCNE